MATTDTSNPKRLAGESAQAIEFLMAVSDRLKQQRRHFDDAVVSHCIRLIHDYMDERGATVAPEVKSPAGLGGRRY